MNSAYTTVKYSSECGVVRLLLDCAERHNALGQHELDQLLAHLVVVANDTSARVVVLSGAGGKTFCSGAALDQLDGEQFNGDNFARVTGALASLTIPTVCALNGNVFGAGVDLALACDFRIGLTNSRMRIPASVIGVCYPPDSIHRITSELGAGVARRLLMLAETFDAQAMYDCGFLYRLVEPAELDRSVTELLDLITGLAPRSISSMKQIIAQSANQQRDSASANALMATCFSSDDFREGLAAQKEKRAAKFTGN